MCFSRYVKEGDRVQELGRLCEVQSGAEAVTITSRHEGIIKQIHVKVDENAIVGSVLVDIETRDEEEVECGTLADRRFRYGMSPTEFRRRGRQMVDYIADYMENVHTRRVVPTVEPGYLQHLLPLAPPQKPEGYEQVMADFERFIMPGVLHWQHPRFHAYFPAGNSYPSILADMLSDALGCMGFSWASCPAMTELEMIMMQWFGQMIGLPKDFLPFTDNARGGGVIQGSASDCTFIALLGARFEAMQELHQRFPFVEEGVLMSKLIAYCSTEEDRQLGLIPFFVSTTLGTTSSCSFDVLTEIGPVCTENDLWLHVDAAYAGAAFVCPEYRYLLDGIEHAMSFNTNPNKWMLVNYDCSAMWVKDRFKLTQALVVDPLYLQHSWMDKAIDYRHWGIPLSRRFRSLKLWFVIRMYGIEGIQNYIREHVRLAKKFEALLLADDQFEVVGDVLTGLVCFRLKGSNELNQALLTTLNCSGQIHMIPASLNGRYVIRFCVCQEHASDEDILAAYDIIKQAAKCLHYDPKSKPMASRIEQLNDAVTAESQGGQSQAPSRKRFTASAPQEEKVSPTAASTFTSLAPSAGVVLPMQGVTDDAIQSRPRVRLQASTADNRMFLARMASDAMYQVQSKVVRYAGVRNKKPDQQEVFRDQALREAFANGCHSLPHENGSCFPKDE
ncbi:Aromatic-L-amino-acid decarboxylase [Aphelenchoides avenae]|nr:Aromatic-L-amino-acid decarboxylase [Aphelenchus avenae]